VTSIDLNADMGEIPALLADGSEERLLAIVTSTNIACGGHAGTPESMRALVELALRHGVAVGAHPSFPDRANFGREPMAMDPADLARSVEAQVRALDAIAGERGASIHHIKPHGALYNVAVRDAAVAHSIADGLERWRTTAILVGLAGSGMLEVWRGRGFRVAAEAFADRRYEPDGTLRSRRHADALLLDPAAAAEQAVGIGRDRQVVASNGGRVAVAAETLCVHGDTPNAIAIARAVRAALENSGVGIEAFEP